MKFLFTTFLLSFFASLQTQAQRDTFFLADDEKLSVDEYISLFSNLAMKEMKRAGIPASITLAQGLLESGNGNSYLARVAQNHFGIKCGNEWTGMVVHLDDDSAGECFRRYDQPEESYKDHSDFLHANSRYDTLFKLDTFDYKGWAYGLKYAGYATNPRYPLLLINTIEKYSLARYDSLSPEPEFKSLYNTIELENKKEEKVKNQFRFKGVPAYIVKENETIESIAKKLEMDRLLIRKFNELNDNEEPTAGTIIYLKSKEKEGDVPAHVVKEGEGMYYISQLHRIRIKYLYRKNKMDAGQEPQPGELIWLKDKRPSPPKLIPDGGFGPIRMGIQTKDTLPPATLKNLTPVKQTKDTVSKLKNVARNNQSADVNTETKIEKTTIDTSLVSRMNTTLESIEKQMQENEKTLNIDSLATQKILEEKRDTLNKENKIIKDTFQKIIQPKPVVKQVLGENKKSLPPANNIINKNPVKTEIKTGKTLPPSKHIVQPKQTLFGISKMYNIKVEDLIKWNNIKDNKIEKGQELWIRKPYKINQPKDSVSVKKDVKLPEAERDTLQPKKDSIPLPKIKKENRESKENNSIEKGFYVKVKEGETLKSLASKYHVSKAYLRELNKLKKDKLRKGQIIRIK